MYINISNTKTKYFFLVVKSFTYLILVANKDVCFKRAAIELWPEAESNCRPLVFQIWANHLTLAKYNLFDLIIRSLLTGSREQ